MGMTLPPPRPAAACFPLLLLLLQAILLGLLSLPPCTAENVMYATQPSQDFLCADQYLAYGSYKFIMQDDCNLVLYDGSNAVWSSGTAGEDKDCRATLTYEGLLQVTGGTGKLVWNSTITEKVQNYVLVLQRDRNVVIYSTPIWATGTNPSALGDGFDMKKAANTSSLDAATVLNSGDKGPRAVEAGRKMIHMVVTNVEA